MDVTANGLRVIAGEIYEPARGPWTARVEIDDDGGKIDGAVEIAVGPTTFRGLAEGAVQGGRYVARVVGGEGGLKRLLPAKYYYQTQLRTVVDDILSASGEELDLEETELTALQTTVPRWARLQTDARAALSSVAVELGGFWRVSRAGRIVVRKNERWDELRAELVELDRDQAGKTALYAPEEDQPLAAPGLVYRGERIAEVRTTFAPSSIRQSVSFEDPSRSRGLAAAISDAAKRAVESGLSYAQFYPARVVAQDPDGTVHLLPDDAKLRGQGLTKIPLRHGIPGVRVKVALGERVALFFENGDPKRPAAALWPDGSSVREVRLHGELVELGGPSSDFVALAGKVDALFEVLTTAPPGVQDGGKLIQQAVKTAWDNLGGSVAAKKTKAE